MYNNNLASLGVRKPNQARPRCHPCARTQTLTHSFSLPLTHTHAHAHTRGQKLIHSRYPPEYFSLFWKLWLPSLGSSEGGDREAREAGAGCRCVPRPLLPGESPGRVLRRVPELVSRPPAAAAAVFTELARPDITPLAWRRRRRWRSERRRRRRRRAVDHCDGGRSSGGGGSPAER